MIAATVPYMHNGVFATLRDVIGFYDGIDSSLDPLLVDFEPSFGSGVDDLIAFFEAISDGEFDRRIPTEVPSGLTPGGP